jgi:predicted RNA binding protein YcfA (HicA-like mRNA interferase family)
LGLKSVILIYIKSKTQKSGKEILKMYIKKGWKKIRHKGSHVIISKDSLRETIPMHKELKKGLENHLLKKLNKK